MDYVLNLHLVQREIPSLLQATKKSFSADAGKISGGLGDQKLTQLLSESTSTDSIIGSSAFDWGLGQ